MLALPLFGACGMECPICTSGLGGRQPRGHVLLCDEASGSRALHLQGNNQHLTRWREGSFMAETRCYVRSRVSCCIAAVFFL